jgi:AraC-like DNA-binding protein
VLIALWHEHSDYSRLHLRHHISQRLAECGTSYQALLDQARREAARRTLANTGLQANQIAFLLGFQEPNSFYRAFQHPANGEREREELPRSATTI